MTQPLKVGDRVRDNRWPERVITVVGFDTRWRRAVGFVPAARLSMGTISRLVFLDRIHTDGRTDRRTGWSVVR